ncbi:hypothetical protein PVL29_002401 [Vitis rotundifolia]|uniref:Uncharacterized protein n=1 Tax=Vitis rotundifolia TaxID=103349 RepID=A0AA39AGT9_VITRO|nr:hypothetical protein PVL29_002401 [Vitis rotundifolia]
MERSPPGSPAVRTAMERSPVGSPAARAAFERSPDGSPAARTAFERSPDGSPAARPAFDSPSGEFLDSSLFQSDYGGADSFLSGDKSFDEPTWGKFDSNDDMESIWGMNSIGATSKMDHERHIENYFFGDEFDLKPIRTESSQASGSFPKKRTVTFDDSVPSTPLYSIINSPSRFNEGSVHSFNPFSRFDSFNCDCCWMLVIYFFITLLCIPQIFSDFFVLFWWKIFTFPRS